MATENEREGKEYTNLNDENANIILIIIGESHKEIKEFCRSIFWLGNHNRKGIEYLKNGDKHIQIGGSCAFDHRNIIIEKLLVGVSQVCSFLFITLLVDIR